MLETTNNTRNGLTSFSELEIQAKDLAKKLNSHRPTVSNVLSELKNRGLVKRLNPSEKNVSIYGLTEKGKKVANTLKKMQ